MRINRENLAVLYYLSSLTNRRGLVFDGEKITISFYNINVFLGKTTKQELAVIHTALCHGLLLNEYDKNCFLVKLKENLNLVVRRNSVSDITEVVETFVKNSYRRFYRDLKGKVVLDVGAFIGDTAICFSYDGARMVYAYEPVPIYYDLAMKNIRLNKLDNVKLFNVGVGAAKGKFIAVPFGASGETKIDIIPLGEAIEQIGEVDLLKMDCEGCEFPALLSLTRKHLHKIKEMIVEYHKNPLPIVRKLQEAGFVVNVEKPWTYVRGEAVGFFYARKVLNPYLEQRETAVFSYLAPFPLLMG